ncbi:MAG: Rpp14/Pop5 family protein [Nanoarchaeota archaeon]
MAQMKPLMPTLRERKRYLAFEVLAKKECSWNAVKQAVRAVLQKYVGIDGAAKAGVLFVKNNKNKAVLRVAHTSLNTVRAAFVFITEIEKQKVIVKSIGASGMLHKAVKYIE